MAKNDKADNGRSRAKDKSKRETKQANDEAIAPEAQALSGKQYRTELVGLHAELVKVQLWAKATGAKVCIVFEGRDGAGKGGVIKAIMERVSPRIFRVIALPPPTEREKTQMYLQRYLPHMPAGGEIVIFDRSWYNRAGVERVMGFCSEKDVAKFLDATPLVEKAFVDSGIILLKYWLEVGQEEQTRRMKERIEDPRKVWKLSPMDLESYKRWYDFSRARDEMFLKTDTAHAPWFAVRSDDKKRMRLNVISHILSKIPYEEMEQKKVKLPKRDKDPDYAEPHFARTWVPEVY